MPSREAQELEGGTTEAMGNSYPSAKKGVKVAAIAGTIAGALSFGASCWMASLPAITDVSICWSFRPWWRLSNWVEALVFGIIVGTIAGLIATFRPQRPRRKPDEC